MKIKPAITLANISNRLLKVRLNKTRNVPCATPSLLDVDFSPREKRRGHSARYISSLVFDYIISNVSFSYVLDLKSERRTNIATIEKLNNEIMKIPLLTSEISLLEVNKETGKSF